MWLLKLRTSSTALQRPVSIIPLTKHVLSTAAVLAVCSLLRAYVCGRESSNALCISAHRLYRGSEQDSSTNMSSKWDRSFSTRTNNPRTNPNGLCATTLTAFPQRCSGHPSSSVTRKQDEPAASTSSISRFVPFNGGCPHTLP